MIIKKLEDKALRGTYETEILVIILRVQQLCKILRNFLILLYEMFVL